MDSESLKIFCAVAAELSITHAASWLGRVPSNVTTRVRQLEAELGVDLFVRTGKRLSLSSAGEHFLQYANRWLLLEQEARHAVGGNSDGGVLRLGSMESTTASRLPTLLSSLHHYHPDTQLELATGVSRQLLEGVRTGRLDCAFIALPPTFEDVAVLTELGLQATRAWHEQLELLIPASESSKKGITGLASRQLAAFGQGCVYRSIAEELLGTAGSPEWTVTEMSSCHGLIAAVAAGSAVALLPTNVIRNATLPAGLKTLPAGGVDTFLISRKGYGIPAFQHLMAQLEDTEE